MTGKPLGYRFMMPNHSLRSLISEFRRNIPQMQRDHQTRTDLDLAIQWTAQSIGERNNKISAAAATATGHAESQSGGIIANDNVSSSASVWS